ncbi:hypothetical protein [Vibrio cyclitrophicus]|uniref:Uncharacterized protein n=1 Tax=Vibrio cyclitrophicus ZF270 TaxID=1136176 RepID=A0AAN0LKJ5_9VIBR|nr:hypothetical protein [Vibrio cyclitrophicus]OEE06442.1 hypothetical protein OC7_02390 [Vibrio cyclitrophicus ZF270]PMH74498.1 hypothetical protein BCU59_19800 [Vibrio cyclitrophicus]
MYLVVSGEGETDIGKSNEAIGPLSKLIDKFIEPYSGYSLLDANMLEVVHETRITEISRDRKIVKPLVRRGKKTKHETREFYSAARALAYVAQSADIQPSLAVLFHDSDSNKWPDYNTKRLSMEHGFEAQEFENGVPFVAQPKSEAWLLCALKNGYQNCAAFEVRSGNDDSPRSLKGELEAHLGEPATRVKLNEFVEDGLIDLAQITDMKSMTDFQESMKEVLGRMLGIRIE